MNQIPSRPLIREINVLVNDKSLKSCSVTLIADTGAGISVISDTCNALDFAEIKLDKTDQKVTGAFGNDQFRILGAVDFGLAIDDEIISIRFYVVNSNNFQVLLGWPENWG